MIDHYYHVFVSLICDASFNSSLNLLLAVNTHYLCSASCLLLGISGDSFVPLKKKKVKNNQTTTSPKTNLSLLCKTYKAIAQNCYKPPGPPQAARTDGKH